MSMFFTISLTNRSFELANVTSLAEVATLSGIKIVTSLKKNFFSASNLIRSDSIKHFVK
jgi:hypothetical protein